MDARNIENVPSLAMLSVIGKQFKKHVGMEDHNKLSTRIRGFFYKSTDTNKRAFVERKLKKINPEFLVKDTHDIYDLQLTYLLYSMYKEYRPFILQFLIYENMIDDDELRNAKSSELIESLTNNKWHPLSNDELQREAEKYSSSNVDFEEILQMSDLVLKPLEAISIAPLDTHKDGENTSGEGVLPENLLNPDTIRESIAILFSLGSQGARYLYLRNKNWAGAGESYPDLHKCKIACMAPMVLSLLPGFMMARDYTAVMMLMLDSFKLLSPDLLEIEIPMFEVPAIMGEELFRMALADFDDVVDMQLPYLLSSPKPELIRYFIECNEKCAVARTEEKSISVITSIINGYSVFYSPLGMAVHAIFTAPEPDDNMDRNQAEQWIGSLENIAYALLDNEASFDEVRFRKADGEAVTIRDSVNIMLHPDEDREVSDFKQYKHKIITKLLNYQPKLQSDQDDVADTKVTSCRTRLL